MRSIVGAITVCGILNGCYTWQPSDVAPAAMTTAVWPREVRLELQNGRHIEMARPRVDGDSLRGVRLDPSLLQSNARVVALADVTAVRQRRLEPNRTALAILAGIGAGFVLRAGIEAIENARFF